jgi:hypothetical protein
MEVIGFAASIISLASLFSTCIDLIEKIESYKDCGSELRSVTVQFDADKHLFRKWAQSVGIYQVKLNNTQHEDLENPETRAIVEKILSSILEIFDKTESVASKLQHISEGDPKLSQENALFSHGIVPSQQFQLPVSRTNRIKWALTRKAKFIAQVQQFEALVRRLHSLVPPHTTRRAVEVKPGTGLGFSTFSDGIYPDMLIADGH